MKRSFFAGHGFSHEMHIKPYLTFYMTKVVLCIYRFMPEMLCFRGCLVNFCTTRNSRCFGLNVVFANPLNTDTLQVWYASIDTHFLLLYVKFENKLSISVLRNKAARTTGNLKGLKKKKKKKKKSRTSSTSARSLHFTLCLFRLYVAVAIGQD
jgi:hypothetical protein